MVTFLYNKARYIRWKQDHMKIIWKYFSATYTSYLVLYSQKCQTSVQPSVWNTPLPRSHSVSSKRILMLFRKIRICRRNWNIYGFYFQGSHMICHNMIRINKNYSAWRFVFIIITNNIIINDPIWGLERKKVSFYNADSC